MIIKFKTKRLLMNLILGGAWLSVGLYVLWYYDEPHWSYYAYLFLGILYTGIYLYEYVNQYLIIKNGAIYKKGLFRKEEPILLKDIQCIRMYAGDLILKTKECEMRINTELIDKKSLCELEKLLNKLDLDTEEAILLTKFEARTENA